jgi:diguanylate cyclase (GGDEF)-like protein/PAS domain S-box-containing protein
MDDRRIDDDAEDPAADATPVRAHVGLPQAARAALLERIPELVVVIDAAGLITHANERMLRTMGYELAAVVGTNVFDYVHPDDLAYMAWSWEARQAAPGEPGLIVQGRGRNADGTWRACEVIGMNLLEDEEIAGMVITMRDLSRQAALADSPARLRSMVDRTSDVVLLLDPRGAFVYANRRLTSRYNHDNDRIIGRDWTTILDPDDVPLARRWFQELVDGGDGASARVRLRIEDPHGVSAALEWHGTNQMADPLIDGIILSGRDISDLVSLEEQLREQNTLLTHAATHDPLTGFLNRTAFVEQMAASLADRRACADEGDVVVLFCDLDGFKAVNDEFGHAAGDDVLAIIAARLADSVRAEDVLGRYGGDEFTILLGGDVAPAVVTGLVARLKAKVLEPVALPGFDAHVGVTVGISRAPVADADLDALLRDADAAMYQEKRRHPGGGR